MKKLELRPIRLSGKEFVNTEQYSFTKLANLDS